MGRMQEHILDACHLHGIVRIVLLQVYAVVIIVKGIAVAVHTICLCICMERAA
jgi:hypothetical protein